ncbi:MAG: hypothetical protein DMG65_05905 [Candidatus Angelobacter sp. Gp1-AA117]|nr:MAG: hypothetical protein DMG65_05905 [Candidatus Angelobacter sp. Gp1-AA117]
MKCSLSFVRTIAVFALFLITGIAEAQIKVDKARIGCLDIQPDGNLTAVVASACNGKGSCSFKAPTPDQYKREGVQAHTRLFCTQAMEIIYHCGSGPTTAITVPGDAWDKPPAQLVCAPPPTSGGTPSSGGVDAIEVTRARIGCLDIQPNPNLTALVANACNGKGHCSFKAPTPDEYRRAGVQAHTRDLCTQAMEITFRCGWNDEQTLQVPGDAWNHPPAQMVCDGGTIATNQQYVTPPPSESCGPVVLGRPAYFIAPRDMLDWTPNGSHGDYTFQGFSPPQPTLTPSLYNSPAGTLWPPDTRSGVHLRTNKGPIAGAPVSTLGANEGRLRAELRAAAATARTNPLATLCQAAQSFTRNRPATADTPSDQAFGNALADLSVTGRNAFANFVRLAPRESILDTQPGCRGASPAAMTAALNRAYNVARALRLPHTSTERQSLGWIAVSGEDDQPYRPVNVPSNQGGFPEFQTRVDVPKFHIAVNTRYMIAHDPHHPPVAFTRPATPLVNGGPGRVVPADPLPALANDAEVILFIHGMDSRLEEANDLTEALHKISGHNFTVISMDLPTSGYADNLSHERQIAPIADVRCHNTPLVDFVEEFIVDFVNTLDGQLGGRLKPRIKAVVGGSLGGNMAMRLGRRTDTPWITTVVPWSPAAIWPSMIARGATDGCDTSWNAGGNLGVQQALKWGGLEERFRADHETPELRRELFYGGFDFDGGDMVAIFSGNNHKPQAACWFSDGWRCKPDSILAARLDRQETYDANFRVWHWRLGAEQLVFSQQQFSPGTNQPLYLRNTKRMLLFCGVDDVCADLCKDTRDVAPKMVNTPGCARFLRHTGHSLDNEHPDYIAREIADFVGGSCR